MGQPRGAAGVLGSTGVQPNVRGKLRRRLLANPLLRRDLAGRNAGAALSWQERQMVFARLITQGRPGVAGRGHGKKCPYCQRTMDRHDELLRPTRDHHPIPRSRGGTETILACYKCNHTKGDMSAEEWDAFMLANPNWFVVTGIIGRRERASRPAHRVIRKEPEKPSTPMAEPLMQLKLTQMIGREFEHTFCGAKDRR